MKKSLSIIEKNEKSNLYISTIFIKNGTIYFTNKYFSNIYLIAISIMVQFIIYPSFKNLFESSFKSFHSGYTKKMFLIVGPFMIIELISSLYLLNISSFLAPTVLVVLIWASTFFLIVPIHNSLNISFDLIKHKKLIRLNLIRTIFWVLKIVI